MFVQKLLLSFLIFAAISSATEYVNRTTKYGRIIGKLIEISDLKAEVFLGVPYAQPPVGTLRFEYPLLPRESTDVFECTKFKPNCVQDVWTLDGEKSEDCLYANIFVPHQESNATYSVLVWIHGGSYMGGSANRFPINTTIKNLVSENIIVVFVNYRLGPLGFLSLANNSLPGNYGLEDQLLALKWVHENIHDFNGDPNRVTITGESAGAASVSLLAISSKAKGLFQRVMPQSGSSLSPWAIGQERTVRNTKIFLQKLNCTVTENRTDFMTCLQKIPKEKFNKLLKGLFTAAAYFLPSKDDDRQGLNHIWMPYFTPVVDKYRNDGILQDRPDILLQHNANVTILTGTTNFELIESTYMQCVMWNHFVSKRLSTKQFMSIDLDVESIKAKFPFTYENESVIDWEVFLSASLFKNPKLVYQAVEKFYKVDSQRNVTENIKQIAKINSDFLFIAPAVQEAIYYAKNHIPTYFYYYSEDKNKALLNTGFSDKCGTIDDFQNAASHGNDLARLFQTNQVLFRRPIPADDWETGNLNMNQILSRMITNFVKTGNPNDVKQNARKWLKFTEKNKSAFFLHPTNPKMIDMKVESNHKFWYDILRVVESLKCN